MSHWLEDAERDEQRKKQKPLKESAKIQDKMFRIKQNYEVNHEAYLAFINRLQEICERANNLPAEKKEPWNHIDAKAKESKLENHLYYFSTNQRFEKRVITKSFPFVKNQHYKNIRVAYFSISKEMGKVEVEIKEDFLAKTRLSADDNSQEKEWIDDGLKRMDMIFLYDITDFDKEHALKILDWLVFKEDFKSLPFREEHFKYKKF
jgi:hypothetical protein